MTHTPASSSQLVLPGTLVLAGAGKMGGAMLRGWLDAGAAAAQIAVVDPQPAPDMLALAAEQGFSIHPDASELNDVAIVVLAVKPQILDAAATTLAPVMASKPLVVSIAAGKSVADIIQALGDSPVVRSMPNTPASVGRGITAAYAGSDVSNEQRDLATALLKAVGDVVWLDDEDLMDAVTAVSGSGPAYVFWLAECMAAAGRELGLPDDLADALARATVSGAGELMHQAAEPASTLRENVTSPGGTTAAALAVLMADDGLKPLMAKALTAARDRAREL
ncbi:pyrroline-5-carboxylate reductase [Pyruvatibacter sp. HU-CL02332]|uniref:pyrroline-5-carboxylate reductase n=1 Tax=Pyruvatibacter sp. HU-CL02332 TaxID=3127650 RepID=UPI0029692D13|nr:pyrroline-5-carboxylate reductase [Alphaproteobacteria bacterium]